MNLPAWRFRAALLLVLNLMITGCATLIHHSGYQSSEAATNFASPDHVHIVLIHGLDPFDFADLQGVKQQCENWGYTHIQLFQFYQSNAVVDCVAQAKAEDPQAKFLVLGFSAGTMTAKKAVKRLHDEYMIEVNTLIYQAGFVLRNSEETCPKYVGKVINVRDCGSFPRFSEIQGAENHRFSDVWHFGSPTHPRMYAILEQELACLCKQ